MQTPPRIIICGAPASGKGTQCEFIKAEFGTVHLSTGDILRAQVAANTSLGAEAKAFMDRGELVPDNLMIRMILDRLNEEDCRLKGWLLDGFPRTGAQADALMKAGVNCDILIQLDVEDSLLVERVVGRRSDPVTNKIYHLTFSPPETEEIRARLIHRSDDTEEKVMVRLQAYHKNLASILDKYKDRTHRVVVKTNTVSPAVYWPNIKNQIIRSRKFAIVFVLGGPGSGKGTLCERIELEFGYKHLSAGDLLRDRIKRGGPLADQILKTTVSGGIVPAEVTVEILSNAMMESGKRKFLVDGFPRNADNMSKWMEMMGASSIVDFVLFLECDEATMKARLLNRGVTSGRPDDNMESIVQRFHTFYHDSMPVLDTCKRLGMLRSVNAMVPPHLVFQSAAALFRGNALSPRLSRTFGMCKPDAVSAGHVPAILEAIAAAGLVVVLNKLVYMNAEVVTQFYAEHSMKSFFPNLRSFMTSGPSLLLILEGVDAVSSWRTLIGPTADAPKIAPNTLRGKFATDGTRNACHGADSEMSAMREIDFWTAGAGTSFEMAAGSAVCVDAPATATNNNRSLSPARKQSEQIGFVDASIRTAPIGLPREDTFAMIKPDTVDLFYDEIFSITRVHGFDIVAETRVTLTKQQAEGFYAEHFGKPFFKNLVHYMSSGPAVLLHLRREGSIPAWRALIGPTNSSTASAFAPASIRGLFGVDNTRNAVHGSDSASSAAREIAYFFSFGQHNNQVGRSHGTNQRILQSLRPVDQPANLVPRHARKVKALPSINRKDVEVMTKYAYETVDPIMQVLMRKLLIERPAKIDDFITAELANTMKLQSLSQSASAPNLSGGDSVADETDVGSLAPLSGEGDDLSVV